MAAPAIFTELSHPEANAARADLGDGQLTVSTLFMPIGVASGDMKALSCRLGWHRWVPRPTKPNPRAQVCLRCRKSDAGRGGFPGQSAVGGFGGWGG